MVGAIQSVQVGMGEPVLILAFVVIVIGGIGSIRARWSARCWSADRHAGAAFLLPQVFGAVHGRRRRRRGIGAALASMLIYILMAVVLVCAAQGPVRGAAT